MDSKSGQPIGRVAVLIHLESYARAAGWLRAGRQSGMFSSVDEMNRARNCFTARSVVPCVAGGASHIGGAKITNLMASPAAGGVAVTAAPRSTRPNPLQVVYRSRR